jgi:hypothetical protein
MKKCINLFLLLAIISTIISCGKNINVDTYLISTDIQQIFSQDRSLNTLKPRNVNIYICTPIDVTGQLEWMAFLSDNTVDDSNYYFPPDVWTLRDTPGNYVFFDLSQRYEVSEGSAGSPSAIGYGIYQSIHFQFIYLDVEFLFDNNVFCVRMCPSTSGEYVIGDLLLRDDDGNFKWISKSGDPNMLLSERPDDPVISEGIGWPDHPDWTDWISPAHIPEEYYFDVPSDTGNYEIILDFIMENTVMMMDVDIYNYTRRDILEHFDTRPFMGAGGTIDNILKVKPKVTYLGDE